MNSGHQPNGINSGYQPNGINSGHQPDGINPQRQPNGMTSGHQPTSITSGHQSNGVDSGHQPNGINPQLQQNGVIPPTRHTPNGISSQHERGGANVERQQSHSAPRGRAPMSLQPAPMVEDDYPVTAIRVPVRLDEEPHYTVLEIRDCDLLGCRCRVPDLRRFLGEYPIRDTDYQTFRALWEPPGMESLHGTYIIFAMTARRVDNGPHVPWNFHFSDGLKGDAFIMKVKEPIDERAAFTNPLGYPVRTLPHYSGVFDARYENIERGFLGSDLFEEMSLAATHPHSRNGTSIQLPIPVGFWRALVQGRVRLDDYQVPPVTPGMDLIMERFLPPHGGRPPPLHNYEVHV